MYNCIACGEGIERRMETRQFQGKWPYCLSCYAKKCYELEMKIFNQEGLCQTEVGQ
jgi:hypothetical protein